MASRRGKRSKKLFKKNPVLSIIVIVILVALAVIFRPWEYIDISDAELPTSAPETTAKPSPVVVTPDSDDLQVHFIDVGQADCILIRVPSGDTYKNILFDAGTSKTDVRAYTPDDIMSYLRNNGVTSLEYMFLSHPHADHDAAADEIIRKFPIENIILPECDPAMWGNVLDAMDDMNQTFDTAEYGTVYTVGDLTMKILGPIDPSVLDSDKNNYSIILKLVYGDTSFLLTGDAESAGEAQTLDKFGSGELDCDVLKVGHHGSNTSSSVAFLNAVSPDIAVICVGEGNSYGHPTDKIIERLTKYVGEANILRTDKLGTIILVSDKESVSRISSD